MAHPKRKISKARRDKEEHIMQSQKSLWQNVLTVEHFINIIMPVQSVVTIEEDKLLV